MSFNGVKKQNPRLRSEEVYSYIASKTDLSQQQVRECFITYADMLKDIAINKYTDKSITIPLPHIGQFYFAKYTGRKSGSTYCFFKEPHEKGSKMITLDKPEPSFHYLKLKIGRTFHNSIKKHTEFYE